MELIKELQIGSYLFFLEKKENVQVVSIPDNQSIIISNNNIDEVKIDTPERWAQLKGIELTEEILSKNGFVKKETHVYGLIGEYTLVNGQDIYIIKRDNIFSIAIPKNNSYFGCKLIPLRFIHIAQPYFNLKL